MSLNFMLISSKDFLASSSFIKVSVNHLLNLSIMISFTDLLTVKSKLGKRQSCHLGQISKLFCFLSTMMSSPQSSDFEKRPVLKVQIDGDFQFFSFQLRHME